MTDILKFIDNLMNEWNLSYAFDDWDKDLELPHFIGEILENPSTDEDGMSEYTFMLTGFDTDLNWLFEISEQLKREFKPSKIVDNMAIMYDSTSIIPTQTEGINQMQVNFRIKKWSN